jgi:two-component system, NtrC family, response regulator AtoC
MSTEPRGRVLVVEDDEALAGLIVDELETEGLHASAVTDVDAALDALQRQPADLVVSDLRLPGRDGLALLEQLRGQSDSPAFLMITAFATVNQAVEALKAGADDFLTKPLDMDHLLLTVRKLLETRRLRAEVQRFRELLGTESFHGLIGRSPAMRQLFEQIRRIARASGPVLIIGESGTGKELVARAVHAESDRADGPFLAVNCAGVPGELLESEFFGHVAGAFTGARKAHKGLFARAEGGTLLLDEIGEMPLTLQAKLLRALQDGRIRPVGAEHEETADVRIVAATNQNLSALIRDGRFREDLFFRLETFALRVPPLREREDDRELLARQFLKRHATALDRPVDGLDDAVLAWLRRYQFPGNVRELGNAIERAVAFCDGERIELEHLPARLRAPTTPEPSRTDAGLPEELLAGPVLPNLEELQRRYIHHVLRRVDGNKRRAAALLGIGRRTLYRWLEAGD